MTLLRDEISAANSAASSLRDELAAAKAARESAEAQMSKAEATAASPRAEAEEAWVQMWSSTSAETGEKKTYWLNEVTGESSWTDPGLYNE